MAFTVEDGTGLEAANAYISVEFADSYHLDRGRTSWAGDTLSKQWAIVQASDYIDQRWSTRFKGTPLVAAQALAWPREDAWAGELELTEIPVALKRACAEYALRALTARLLPDPTTDDIGREILEKTEKVGPIEETTVYAPGGRREAIKPYPEADFLMRPLLTSAGQLVRA